MTSLAIALAGIVTSFFSGRSDWSSDGRRAWPGELAQWEAKLAPDLGIYAAQAKRALADAPAPVCLKDRLEHSQLIADIRKEEQDREKARPGRQFAEPWNGVLDKNQLPTAQLEFLDVDGGKHLRTEGVDFSGCSDVPCILDRIYGSPDTDGGLKQYLFYLKTGYVISTRPEVPSVKGEQVNFAGLTPQDFLFDQRQLEGFWRLAWTLPPSLRHLPSLVSIHLVPKGAKIPGWNEYVCGEAWGTRTHGWIRSSESCLEIPNPVPIDYYLPSGMKEFSPHFYKHYVHEITHRLDFLLGHDSLSWSEQDDWIDLGGWRKDEVVEEDGTKISWEAEKPGSVTDYAKSSPAEDLAETASFVRFNPRKGLAALIAKNPTDEQKVLAQKLKLVSQKIFEGRTFDTKGLTHYYADRAASLIHQKIPDLVGRCIAQEPQDASDLPQNHPLLEIDLPISSDLKNCLDRAAAHQLSAALNVIRATEYEACGHLEYNERALRREAFQKLAPLITPVLAEQKSLSKRLHAIYELRKRLSGQVDPSEAFLYCQAREDAQACFDRLMGDAFDLMTSNLTNDLGDARETEKREYLAANGFDRVRIRTTERFLSVFAGIGSKVADQANQTWDRCLDLAGKIENNLLLTLPFTGGEQYIDAGILNCVNVSVEDDVDQAIHDHATGLGIDITESHSKAFLHQLLTSTYLNALKERLSADATLESQRRSQLKPQATARVINSLSSNLAWIAESRTGESANTSCLVYAQKILSSNPIPVKFASIEDLINEWARDACAVVMKSQNVQEAMNVFALMDWDRMLKELDQIILNEGTKQAKECRQRDPGTSAPEQFRRKYCLKQKWQELVRHSIEVWKSRNPGLRIPHGGTSVEEHLVSRSDQLLTQVIGTIEN